MNIFELGKIRLPNLYPEVQEHLSNHILRRFYRLFTKKPILITPIQLPVSVTLPKFCVIAVAVTTGKPPGSPNKNLYSKGVLLLLSQSITDRYLRRVLK